MKPHRADPAAPRLRRDSYADITDGGGQAVSPPQEEFAVANLFF